jgi:hypothetical protein
MLGRLTQALGGTDALTRFLPGSYRIATALEPNSTRLTSFKSKCFDIPASNRPMAR